LGDEFFEVIDGATEETKILIATAEAGKFFVGELVWGTTFKKVDHRVQGMAFFTLPVPGGRAENDEVVFGEGLGVGVGGVD